MKPKHLSYILFAFLTLAAAGNLSAQSAVELNTRGFQLYKKKKYGEALKLFKQAAKLDPNYALAHYNAACTLGVLRKQNKTCENDAYRSAITDFLKKSVELDPGRRERMKSDPDLEPVHDTYAYQILLGLNPQKESDIRLILRRVVWYGPAPGTLGPISRLEFKSDGVAILHSKSLKGGELVRKREHATYEVRKNRITILRKDPQGKTIRASGQLNADGTLRFSEGMPPSMRRFTDDPDDCSA